ncbi:hypothetical protein AVEN_135951-1, partial [Araneus ventricosus]
MKAESQSEEEDRGYLNVEMMRKSLKESNEKLFSTYERCAQRSFNELPCFMDDKNAEYHA